MDNHLFQTILNYLHQNPQMGIWFAFLVAFSESLPIIGTIIPGSITMTIIGVLMGSGGLPFLPTLLIASAAAFCGDCIGYGLGFYYNERIRTLWPFKNYLKWINKGEAFFKKHGGKSIIIGRFWPRTKHGALNRRIIKINMVTIYCCCYSLCINVGNTLLNSWRITRGFVT